MVNNRLKILFLTNCSPFPIRGGQMRRTYNILKGLSKRHDVYLLSLYEDKMENDPKNIQHLRNFCKYVELLPAPSKILSYAMLIRLLRSLISKNPYTIWRHYSYSYLKRIHELTSDIKFDLIHCDILPLAYTIKDIKDIPCTITDHDVSYLKALRMAENSNNILLKLFLYMEAYKLKRLESRVFEKVEVGIVVSEVDKNRLKKLCPKGNFEVIENGVDTDEFKPDYMNSEADTLSWVGGFGHFPNREGIYFFLEKIYPLIKNKISNVKLYLVGGDVPNKLRRLAETDTSVRITGYVDDPIPYIQNTSIFIAPILSGSGTRLKILEAMAVGKAIVTTSVGCEVIEGINETHYLVADNPEDFAKCIIQCLKDRSLQKYLGANARQLVQQKYDWEIISNKLDIVYQKLKSSSRNL